MMKIVFVLLLSTIVAIFQLQGQNYRDASSSQRLSFALHLYHIGDTETALYVLHSIETEGASATIADSVNFIKGRILFHKKRFEQAVSQFQIVDKSSELQPYAVFYGALSSSYIGDYESSINFLRLLDCSQQKYTGLESVMLAGIALLNRDFTTFDNQSAGFDFRQLSLAESQKGLMAQARFTREVKLVRPLTAGLLSTVIPGAGKIYAGKTGEGVAAFVTVAVLGLITWENYRKGGIEHPGTLLSGAGFALYYVGNIWGSVFAAKRRNDELNKHINENILLDMHIAVRNHFD